MYKRKCLKYINKLYGGGIHIKMVVNENENDNVNTYNVFIDDIDDYDENDVYSTLMRICQLDDKYITNIESKKKGLQEHICFFHMDKRNLTDLYDITIKNQTITLIKKQLNKKKINIKYNIDCRTDGIFNGNINTEIPENADTNAIIDYIKILFNEKYVSDIDFRQKIMIAVYSNAIKNKYLLQNGIELNIYVDDILSQIKKIYDIKNIPIKFEIVIINSEQNNYDIKIYTSIEPYLIYFDPEKIYSDAIKTGKHQEIIENRFSISLNNIILKWCFSPPNLDDDNHKESSLSIYDDLSLDGKYFYNILNFGFSLKIKGFGENERISDRTFNDYNINITIDRIQEVLSVIIETTKINPYILFLQKNIRNIHYFLSDISLNTFKGTSLLFDFYDNFRTISYSYLYVNCYYTFWGDIQHIKRAPEEQNKNIKIIFMRYMFKFLEIVIKICKLENTKYLQSDIDNIQNKTKSAFEKFLGSLDEDQKNDNILLQMKKIIYKI
jgi:hypothetical protein